MKSLRTTILAALLGALLALGLTGCGAPNEEMKAPVMDSSHPDIPASAPKSTQDHPDVK
jgi:hypothetical protein